MRLLSSQPKPAVAVSFQFEEGRVLRYSAMESRVKAAQSAIQYDPFRMDQHPVYETSKAADWFCGNATGPNLATGNSAKRDTPLRLRAIKAGTETLLEHSFDADGRLFSTSYQDHSTLFYDWNEAGQIDQIRSTSGGQVKIKFRSDDLPHSIVYDNMNLFQYEYDLNDNITRLVYPDSLAVERTFTRRRQLSRVNCAGLQVAMDWERSGDLAGFTIDGDGRKLSFRPDARTQEFDLAPAANLAHKLPFLSVHSLGAWRISEGGTLDEMLTPWGDRFCIRAREESRPTIVWGPSGQHRFEYNNDGTFAAATHPDGLRSICYRLEDHSRALCVNQLGVTLLEYDNSGRLCKAVDQYGYYNRLSYASDGSLKRVENCLGAIEVAVKNGGYERSVKTSDGSFCMFAYSRDGKMNRFVTAGVQRDSVARICRMLNFMWIWLGRNPEGLIFESGHFWR